MIRGLLPNSVIIVLLSMILSSCGGASGGTASTGNDSTGDTTVTPTVTLRLVRDLTTRDTDVTTVDPSRNAVVIATVTEVDENVVVNFSTTIGQLNPASGTSLTDEGEATITLQAGALAGAGAVTASIVVDGVTFQSNSVAFQVLEFDEVEEELLLGTCPGTPMSCGTFTPGGMVITLNTVDGEPTTGIPSQGTASISLAVVSSTGTTTTPVAGQDVTISSRCSDLGLASIGQPQSNSNGIVTASYQADEGCEGTDTITAVIANTEATATGSIFVFEPRVSGINFDTVEDASGAAISNIFIRESGGINSARVIFEVVDEHGNPKPDVDVTFELSTTIGGLSLQNTTRKTDADGKVVAFVTSGFIPVTVLVKATVDVDDDNDGDIDRQRSTTSSELSVNTGLPHQGGFSMASTVANVEGEIFNETTTEIRVNLSDQSGNPVADGTSVSFTTEYGTIQPSCNTSAGGCSVEWQSGDPRRPADENVVVPDMFEGTGLCPNPLISDEVVTIDGDQGLTDFVTEAVYRVERQDEVGLVENTDYTVNEDGSGITCDAGSASCIDTAVLHITYDRMFLDEVPGEPGVLSFTDAADDTRGPGIATPPFFDRTDVPCQAQPRPSTSDTAAYLGGFGQVYGGRTTVLAYAQGEESFVDADGDGEYDFNERFTDLPEAFVDHNEDGVFGNPLTIGASTFDNPSCYGPVNPLSPLNPDPLVLDRCYQEGGAEEEFFDFNGDGQFTEGNGIYNGTSCPKEVSERTSFCDNGITEVCEETDRYCTRNLVNIRQAIPILGSGTDAYVSFRSSIGTEYHIGEHIAAISFSGDPAVFTYHASSPVTTNDGTVLAAGTDFTVGFDDGDVPPGIGESATLTAGRGTVVLEVSDRFSGRLPQSTSINVDPDVCDLVNDPSGTIGNSGSLGFTQRAMQFDVLATATGVGAITVNVLTPFGPLQARSIACIAD